jgi:hypothetical protein
MYGTAIVQGKEQYNQEGRLGYENYAAYGLKLWGLDVKQALDYKSNTAFVNLYGQGIPYDRRDASNSGANNYVLSEPYILDGIETGFQALPKAYADRILAAQEARYQATQELTALTEDNLDRPPAVCLLTANLGQQLPIPKNNIIIYASSVLKPRSVGT